MRVSWRLGFAAAALALAAGLGVHQALIAANQGSAKAEQALRAASFRDLEGKPQALSQWRGNVVVLNFWATWCAPCIEEIPVLIELQERYRDRGLVFVGIAIDRKDPVAAFATKMGINYPVVLGEMDAISLARDLGNSAGGLPFTAILDREGKLVKTAIGKLNEAKLEPILKPLL
jgi:thiol-disulfide isomerase/thioredoxin